MILKNHTWGIITDKLKISPDDALKLFGFQRKPNEKYIVFRKWKGKVITNHFTPAYAKTETQLKYADTLAKPIRNSWEKIAIRKKYGALAAFIKTNIKNVVQYGWRSMLINAGTSTPPLIKSASFVSPKKLLITLQKMTPRLPHFAILNQKNYKLYFLSSSSLRSRSLKQSHTNCHFLTSPCRPDLSCRSELFSESQLATPPLMNKTNQLPQLSTSLTLFLVFKSKQKWLGFSPSSSTTF